jgi:hypothetical protein
MRRKLANTACRLVLVACVVPLSAITSCLAQYKSSGRMEKLFYERGKIVTLTDTKLGLKVESKTGEVTKTFRIATSAVIVPRDVGPGDTVNVSYVKRDSQRIVVSLQREPEIGDDDRQSNQPLAVSELVVPDPESSRILNRVGTIEPRHWGWRRGGDSTLSSSTGISGTVVRVQRINSFQTELVVREDPNPPRQETPEITFVVDLLTRVEGPLKKGVHLTVASTTEDDREYATDVIVDFERHMRSPEPR